MSDSHRHSGTEQNRSNVSRRAFLATTAGGSVVALAGCSGGGNGNSSSSSSSSSNPSSSAAGTSSSTSQTTGSAKGKKIKVGVVLPFSGTFASLGSLFMEGIKLAVQSELNGKVGDYEIELVKKDCKFSPSTGVTVTRELLNKDKVDVIMGPVSSAVGLAMKPVIDKAGTATWIDINAATTHLISQNCSPYFIRASYSTYTIGHPMGKWTYDNLGKTAVVAVMDYDFGHAAASAFKSAYKDAGGKVVKNISTSPSLSDYAPVVRNMANTGADAVFCIYTSTAAANFMKAAQSFGLKDKMAITGYSPAEPPVHKALPDATTGVTTEESYSIQLDNPTNQRFIKQYKSMYGKNKYPSTDDEFSYVGFQMLEKGVTEAKSKKPQDVIPELRGATIHAPRGDIKIDPTTQEILSPMLVEKATGPKRTDYKILEKFDPVKSPNYGCDISGTFQ